LPYARPLISEAKGIEKSNQRVVLSCFQLISEKLSVFF
jgi:hypothetical protein